MSEVHHAITAHSNKQHALIHQFLQLDAQRERYIEEAVLLCRSGQPFTVDNINAVTKQINELAKQGIVPQRKYVTPDMVNEYVQRLTKGEHK
ncbi:YpbS family protein [Anoxybacillus sp. J5B_2022]|uniref:YpbS family protein n=1 Tax=Anoxybacillus sp. J5B_2022 TaxID=3003246 RepID=UPI0022863132|nr:YpbS family protein [Anoxybacillus sp. J5B_2022]MCZ0755732.1 YpbS family protein [Anoxybacillus sp. J5B_2022]